MSERLEFDRRLVAVFAADVEGYSRLMGADEVGALKGLTERRAILDKAIAEHRGRIANTAGDSVLAEFGSAVDAVQCAVEAQAALAEANSRLSPDKRINFRIGIHVGDVMVRARRSVWRWGEYRSALAGFGAAGSVCVSGATYEQVRKFCRLRSPISVLSRSRILKSRSGLTRLAGWSMLRAWQPENFQVAAVAGQAIHRCLAVPEHER